VIFDVDDLHEGHDRMDLLLQLKEANPAFRLTAFAPPALGTDAYWESLPDWVELAVHGYHHGGPGCPDALEAANWTYERACEVLDAKPVRFVNGFKAPGWQISDGTYQALAERGWWVADQHYNDHRRPVELRVHCEGDGNHSHHHVQNVCGNGLQETYTHLLARVREAERFQFVSEAVA
jgi:hypothetical protein